MLKVLIDAGADMNALTDDNRTPVFQAAIKNHVDCVECLLKCGVDAGIKNVEDKAPADVTTNDLIKSLLADAPAAKRRKLDTDGTAS